MSTFTHIIFFFLSPLADNKRERTYIYVKLMSGITNLG